MPAPIVAPYRAADVVRALAREPRPAGGPAESRARGLCAERLAQAGFDVREEPFDYSSFVGRWGTPIVGLAALAIVLSASAAGWHGRALLALTSLAGGGAALGMVAMVMARSWVLTFPGLRTRGINLVATRGGELPPVWLMAHLDSKSQPVPILARAAGVSVVAATWIAGLVMAAIQLRNGGLATAWVAIAVCAGVGSVPVIATTVGAASPGALDNASGVATVLAAAASTGTAPIGVCLTSGEELGLAGARAWAQGRAPSVAINCDGVDDRGVTTCMYSGRRPSMLVGDVLAAAARSGITLRAHRLLPGVLTDSVALADAGWSVVTLSRGDVRTLARIHTPRDRADALTGEGIDEVAGLVTEMILRRQGLTTG